MSLEELKERLSAIDAELSNIVDELNVPDEEPTEEESTEEVAEERATTEELETRSAKLMEERAGIVAEIEKAEQAIEDEKRAMADVIASKNVSSIEENEVEKMTNKEIRNSAEYINAYANFIKTGDDAECRALLTENVSGTVPVPEYVEAKIRTAWDTDGIMSRVRKTNFKGNVKVGVEISGDAAAVHTEGAAAPSEEALTLYIANLVPATIKKWIKISDEVIDMGGQAFVDYIFDEIEHKIIKKAADEVVADIVGLTTNSTTAPIRGNVVHSGINDIVDAFATLCDEAENPTIIMNKQSYAYYVGLAHSANYAVDPFMGMDVVFNDTLASAATTGTGICVIVGDLGNGYQANFPAGFEPTFKYDDVSLAEADLVKIVGRLPMGGGVVATKHFATVKQAAS